MMLLTSLCDEMNQPRAKYAHLYWSKSNDAVHHFVQNHLPMKLESSFAPSKVARSNAIASIQRGFSLLFGVGRRFRAFACLGRQLLVAFQAVDNGLPKPITALPLLSYLFQHGSQSVVKQLELAAD